MFEILYSFRKIYMLLTHRMQFYYNTILISLLAANASNTCGCQKMPQQNSLSKENEHKNDNRNEIKKPKCIKR